MVITHHSGATKSKLNQIFLISDKIQIIATSEYGNKDTELDKFYTLCITGCLQKGI